MSSYILPSVRPIPPVPRIERGRLFLVRVRAPLPALPVPRPASFLRPYSSITAMAGDAGLAVFDAMPQRSPAGGPLAALLPPITAANWRTQFSISRPRCPSCGWTDVRRSSAHHPADYMLSVIGLVPYRCRTCSERFHRTRQGLLLPAR